MAKILGVPPLIARAQEVTLLGVGQAFGAFVPELSFGQDQAQGGAVGAAAAKAACVGAGGVWNEQLGQCIQKIQPVISAVLKRQCEASGGVWDENKNQCLPTPWTPPPSTSTLNSGLIVAGAIAVIVGFWVASAKKSKRR